MSWKAHLRTLRRYAGPATPLNRAIAAALAMIEDIGSTGGYEIVQALHAEIDRLRKELAATRRERDEARRIVGEEHDR